MHKSEKRSMCWQQIILSLCMSSIGNHLFNIHVLVYQFKAETTKIKVVYELAGVFVVMNCHLTCVKPSTLNWRCPRWSVLSQARSVSCMSNKRLVNIQYYICHHSLNYNRI